MMAVDLLKSSVGKKGTWPMCTTDLRSCSPNKMSCGGVSKALNVSQNGGRRQTFTGMTNKRRGEGGWRGGGGGRRAGVILTKEP